MRFLLDTHLLIWTAHDSPRLSAMARSLIGDSRNELFFSSASIWETAIKHQAEKPGFSFLPSALRRGLLDNGYTEVPINGDHAVCLTALPLLHKDPFDRILLAQAMVEGLTLMTNDAALVEYLGPVQAV